MFKLSTKLIHAGQEPDKITGAINVPINTSTTFQQKTPGVHSGYEYSRSGNPTRNALENCIAECENGKYGLAFASGSASTASIIHLLQSGDHIISINDVYGGTNRYFQKIMQPCMNIGVDFVDMDDENDVLMNIKSHTKMIWLESPTNPTLKITDIEKIAKIARDKNLILVVDNTFMSPYFQNPLDLGADIVVHSATKYINGHSDVVMGLVVTKTQELYDRLKFIQNGIGAVPSPYDCYMILRGMKTLHLRMREHEKNALAVAKYLEAHHKVRKVIYPGLESHPQHELAKKQMRGFGGIVTFYLKGGLEESRNFLESVKLFILAESLGAVECLIEHPALMTHASVPKEERYKLGIDDSLIRVSVGIEDIDDIIKDLTQALDNNNLD